jgi:hypothetical protein
LSPHHHSITGTGIVGVGVVGVVANDNKMTHQLKSFVGPKKALRLFFDQSNKIPCFAFVFVGLRLPRGFALWKLDQEMGYKTNARWLKLSQKFSSLTCSVKPASAPSKPPALCPQNGSPRQAQHTAAAAEHHDRTHKLFIQLKSFDFLDE